ncbi:MAG TPA: DUF1996 domain-containing protein [Iamia sp.]
MTGRVVAGALALLLLGPACSGDDPTPAAGDPTPTTEDWVAADDDDALFTVDCTFSHRASDDPIVHPGRPGVSDSHEFFGSAATDAASTGPSLRGTATTCEDTEDTAAYWVPTLSVDGVPVDPTFVRAYYRAAPGADVRHVRPPPLGLAMIAGDPEAGGEDHAHDHGGGDPVGAAGWGCGLRPRHLHVEPPTDCTDPSPLTLRLRFPDCWDGERLDAEDHRAHVAPSVDGACPATHPVLMTQLQVSVVWPVTGADAGRVTLSSGAVAGAHGDFLNGWDPDALRGHVDLCIKAKANCTIG